jgi:MFS superfamily sulfate permease-like transporter
VPIVTANDVIQLLPVAVALAVIGYAESASVAQDFATRHNDDIDSDRELIAMGGANALAGVMQSSSAAAPANRPPTIAPARARSSRRSCWPRWPC